MHHILAVTTIKYDYKSINAGAARKEETVNHKKRKKISKTTQTHRPLQKSKKLLRAWPKQKEIIKAKFVVGRREIGMTAYSHAKMKYKKRPTHNQTQKAIATTQTQE